MKKVLKSMRTLCVVLLAILPAWAAAEEPKSCWKDSYGRGFALVPNCGAGEEASLGLCYPKCRDGFTGVGGTCFQNCPAGTTDAGLTCVKNITHRPTFLKETLSTAVHYSKGQCDVKWPRGYLSTEGKLRRGYDPIPSSGPNAMRADEIAVNLKPVYDIGLDECWVCPEGFERSLASVRDSNACVKKSERNNLCEKWSRDNGGPGTCSESAGLLYPAVPSNLSCTANSCTVICPNDYVDDGGLQCAKKLNYSREISNLPKSCNTGYTYDAGLCYPNCRSGFSGVGPVCWATCGTGSKYPTECGASCAKDELACTLEVIDEVLSVMNVVVSVASTASTMGSGTAVKAALQKAVVEGVKKTATKFIQKGILKSSVKGALTTIGKESGKALLDKQKDIIVAIAFGEEFDWTALDPSGIAGVIKAYNKPTCSKLMGSDSTTIDMSKVSGPVTFQWALWSGAAKDIDVGSNGKIWAIGTNKRAGGYGIYRLDNSTWVEMPGAGVRIAVDKVGNAWVVDENGGIHYYNGKSWEQKPGKATDIDVSAVGSVWALGTEKKDGGYGLFQWDGGNFKKYPGSGVRLAVMSNNNVVVAKDNNDLYSMDGGKWTRLPGKGTDVAVGGTNNALYVLGNNKKPGGQDIHYWNNGGWVTVNGGLVALAVDADGKPLGANDKGEIMKAQ